MEPMKPMTPMEPLTPMPAGEAWWPQHLGQPSASGSQDDLRFAFFPEKRRLLVQRGGTVATYDSGERRIGGVSQAEDGSLAFTTEDGSGKLDELPKAD